MTAPPRPSPISSLPLPVYVALRYLKSTRRDAFVSFLTASAAAGLGLGVAALVLALSALTGFQRALRAEILQRTPEIEIELDSHADAAEAVRIAASVDGVRSAQLTVRGPGWLVADGKVTPLELVGFDGALPRSFPGSGEREPGVYVGDRLARAWRLEVGDVLEIASSRPTLSPFGPQPRIRRLPLAGTFEVGRTEHMERLALPLAEARSLLGEGSYRLLPETGGLDAALEVAPALRAALPTGSVVRTWRELNRALFFALRLEKSLMFVAVFLIVLVAALALVSDLTLIIASKQHEVGMLGAMGMSPASLRLVFLLLGGMLALFGVGSGAVIGVVAAGLMDRYELLELPGDVYFLDHVPFAVQWLDLSVILLTTLLLALACSAVAAAKAARLRPVEALRR